MDMLKLSMSCGPASCCVSSDGGASRYCEKRSMSAAQIDTVMIFCIRIMLFYGQSHFARGLQWCEQPQTRTRSFLLREEEGNSVLFAN